MYRFGHCFGCLLRFTKKGGGLEKKRTGCGCRQLKTTAEELTDSALFPRSVWTGYKLDFLIEQMEQPLENFQDSLCANPATDKLGQKILCGIYDWTSGFFPGSLWYAYELTGDKDLKTQAVRYTNMLNSVRYYKDNHDIGFMMNCSYGNAFASCTQ